MPKKDAELNAWRQISRKRQAASIGLTEDFHCIHPPVKTAEAPGLISASCLDAGFTPGATWG